MTINETIKKHNDIYDFSELKGMEEKQFCTLLARKIDKLIENNIPRFFNQVADTRTLDRHLIFDVNDTDAYDIYYCIASSLIDWIKHDRKDLNERSEDIVNRICDIRSFWERCDDT